MIQITGQSQTMKEPYLGPDFNDFNDLDGLSGNVIKLTREDTNIGAQILAQSQQNGKKPAPNSIGSLLDGRDLKRIKTSIPNFALQSKVGTQRNLSQFLFKT